MLDILKRGFGSYEDSLINHERRQTILMAAGAMFGAGSSMAHAASDADRLISQPMVFLDPVEKLEAEFRLFRDLKPEADVLLWYCWNVFIVAENRAVVPLARQEGIEFSHHRLIGPHLYRVHGHNLSYPRDLTTGTFIDTIKNPITEKEVAFPPTVLTSDPGMFYSPEGKRPLDRKGASFTPSYNFFRVEGDVVKAEQIRVPPDNWVTPFIEASHSWSRLKDFKNRRLLRLPMETAGGFVFPFPKWLEMGDVKGHMFGLWSGRKLDGVHQLPIEFYTRATSQHPELLKVDLSAFDK